MLTHYRKPQWWFDLTEDCPTCASDTLTINDRLFFTDGMTISHMAARSVPTVVGKDETKLYTSANLFELSEYHCGLLEWTIESVDGSTTSSDWASWLTLTTRPANGGTRLELSV